MPRMVSQWPLSHPTLHKSDREVCTCAEAGRQALILNRASFLMPAYMGKTHQDPDIQRQHTIHTTPHVHPYRALHTIHIRQPTTTTCSHPWTARGPHTANKTITTIRGQCATPCKTW